MKISNIIIILTFTLILIIIGLIFVYINIIFDEETSLIQNSIEEFVDTISPPGVEQSVFIEIQRIHKKGIEELIRKIGSSWRKPQSYFYTITVDGIDWKSHDINTWDTGYIGWEVRKNVEDEIDSSLIEIKIFESNKIFLRNIEEEVESIRVVYDFKTGRWSGDDSFNDSDGYGHYDGDSYEIWFDFNQFDNDNDDIPFWTEVNVLNSNPNFDDSTSDPDNDGIPTSWEWKWGYDPNNWDNHSFLDPDFDGLENIEEFMMEKWLANPFYKDIYCEVDFMKKNQFFESDHLLFKESQWMVMDKFSPKKITLHFDDGWPGGPTNGGGDYIDHYEGKIKSSDAVGSQFYKYYFSEERIGIFRYVFLHDGESGWCRPQTSSWNSDVICLPSSNKWYIKGKVPPALNMRMKRLSLAVAFMHELGHSLGLDRTVSKGIDNGSMVGRNDLPFFQKIKTSKEAVEYWDDYESIMNYNKFGYYLLDFSDGSHGIRDTNDWDYIDLTYFQKKSRNPHDIEG
jgi:hypothetical protein